MKIAVITFLVNQNYNEAFRDVYFFLLKTRRANFKSIVALVVVLVLESLGLYFRITSDFSATH